MVDEKQIEKLDKRVGELEKSMSANYDALAASQTTMASDLKEIKDYIIGSKYQSSLKQEHTIINEWYKIAYSNGELKFLSDTHKVSKGLYIIGAVVGLSSIYNIVNLFQLIIDNLK